MNVVKGLICYYSCTGNTELACQYIANNITVVDFDFYDIAFADKDAFNPENYALVGFATFADFGGPPFLMKSFLQSSPAVNEKPAFIFITYGSFGGKALQLLREWVKAKGYRVIAANSLHMPESFPPLIAIGLGFKNAPSQRELRNFSQWLQHFNQLTQNLASAFLDEVVIKKRAPDFIFPRTQAKKFMGQKFVDPALCTECGLCRDKCAYRAIEMNPGPVFDMEKCYGCWSCFNHCPREAIYTRLFRGRGHYRGPSADLKLKLPIHKKKE